MPKKDASAKAKRRTKVKKLMKPPQKLGQDEMRKLKGGDWLMSPAGNAKPKGA